MARDDKRLVSVVGAAQPRVERSAAKGTELAPVCRAVVVDVIERKEFDPGLAAADTSRLTTAVMAQRRESVLAKAFLAMRRVALLAPRVRPLPVGAQIELADWLLQATSTAALCLRQGTWWYV